MSIFIYSSTLPPPPSYADTVAQEHSAIVSSSQFKVPVQVTDAAEQDGINIIVLKF